MIVDHKPLSQKTDYTMTFSTTMRDDSDPGNHPASALTIQFSTKPPPPVNPPVAMAVGQNQIAVGEETTFDGSQSTGNITKYVWTITDNQDNIVEVLEGKVVNYTFSQNGRYRVTLRVIDEPSGVWDEDYIEINVTSSVNAGAIILLSSALIIAAAVGGTEVGRVALFMLLAVPVYKRKMKGKDDVETRGMVIGYVRVHPGDTFTDIKTNLGLHNGSATWHLMKLEKDGIIKSQIRGSRRLYFPANMPLPFEDGGDLHEIEKRMLHMVKSDPGMTVKVLAEELGVSSQLALYHMRKLSQKGLVSLERRGLRLKAYPPSKRAT
jgi:DNA-binding MarR family transcriptional regulator